MRLSGLLLTLLLMASTASAQSVWINEIHYDNTGADVNEGVEVAGPAGMDLTGWTIVGYNGSGGASYLTTPLSGIIPDQSNGFGTLSFPIAGLQNGPPDGVALVDAGAQVKEFLSYEGSFVATNGPAATLVSINIGVSESGIEPTGLSLQLAGNGSQASDFYWMEPTAQSMGAINNSQGLVVLGVPGPGARGWWVESVRPNPLTRAGSLTFEVPQRARVALSQYEVNGRLAGRYEAVLGAGRHSAPLFSSGLPSGVYLVRLDAYDADGALRFRATRKFALIAR